jgi:hypothetical protein
MFHCLFSRHLFRHHCCYLACHRSCLLNHFRHHCCTFTSRRLRSCCLCPPLLLLLSWLQLHHPAVEPWCGNAARHVKQSAVKYHTCQDTRYYYESYYEDECSSCFPLYPCLERGKFAATFPCIFNPNQEMVRSIHLNVINISKSNSILRY